MFQYKCLDLWVVKWVEDWVYKLERGGNSTSMPFFGESFCKNCYNFLDRYSLGRDKKFPSLIFFIDRYEPIWWWYFVKQDSLQRLIFVCKCDFVVLYMLCLLSVFKSTTKTNSSALYPLVQELSSPFGNPALTFKLFSILTNIGLIEYIGEKKNSLCQSKSIFIKLAHWADSI